MQESPLGFEYTWADLKPIRVVAITVAIAQLCGAVVGYFVPQFPHWFESIWFGAAIAALPAYLLGLVLQARLTPGRLNKHKVMVRQLGLVAALLSAFAIAMPLLGFGSAA